MTTRHTPSDPFGQGAFTRILIGGLFMAAGLAWSAAASAHGVPDAEAQRLLNGGPLEYLQSGAIHMVTGYDHLLFLFGVMFFLDRFWQIVKFVTAFTIGHSVTLLGATLLGIKADYFLIDAVIAISVIYKGFDNLDAFKKGLGVEPPNALFMVLGFGLIHGFGLSTRLQALPLPAADNGLIERILAFNVGVELGQIAALVVMVAVLALLRKLKGFPVFSKVANGLLVIAGVLLFLFQMHGWLHATYPDEFGFNEDAHYHAHEKAQPDPAPRESLMPRETLMPAEPGL